MHFSDVNVRSPSITSPAGSVMRDRRDRVNRAHFSLRLPPPEVSTTVFPGKTTELFWKSTISGFIWQSGSAMPPEKTLNSNNTAADHTGIWTSSNLRKRSSRNGLGATLKRFRYFTSEKASPAISQGIFSNVKLPISDGRPIAKTGVSFIFRHYSPKKTRSANQRASMRRFSETLKSDSCQSEPCEPLS